MLKFTHPCVYVCVHIYVIVCAGNGQVKGLAKFFCREPNNKYFW